MSIVSLGAKSLLDDGIESNRKDKLSYMAWLDFYVDAPRFSDKVLEAIVTDLQHDLMCRKKAREFTEREQLK